jgi:S-adenosylmethionine uptake transporter
MAVIDNTKLGVIFVLFAMFFISINDMLVKLLSDGYPLHQLVFIRSILGICVTLVILHFEGGWRLLKTRRLGLHALRAGLVVTANMTFFAAIAVMPLADATALFFVAPLFITLLSVLVLGETVGPRRIAAICVGFLGVVVMMRPGVDLGVDLPSRWILTLPLIAAACYAGMQVLTRKLGGESSAAAMAIYIQVTFILVSIGFFVIAGDGRFAEGSTDQSVIFLLRAWTLPPVADWWLFGLMGVAAGGIGYALSQAYRIANASVIAPFEYFNLPMAIFWGWMIFGELPDVWVAMGIALIALSGIYVFLRERVKAEQAP